MSAASAPSTEPVVPHSETDSVDAKPSPLSGAMRWLLLGIVLLAFAHVAIGLGYKAFWWDESLSLQRAESALEPLLRGTILIKDGVTTVSSTDQHPPFYFLLQAILLRTAGESEYTVRFASAMAATLLAPCLFVLARLFARRRVLPPHAALWAAFFAAISPFFLWFGQEARPYALWATLAVLVTYLLLAACEDRPHAWAWRTGYGVTLILFLLTHYYATFLLPVQAVVVYRAVSKRSRGWAIALAALLLTAGAALGLLLYWIVVSQQGGGNFSSVSPGILIPDILNAYSLGLSMDISQVRWLDLVFAIVALAGAVWMVRSRQALRRDGWVVPASIVIPVLVVLIAEAFHPVYMTARHLSLIAGLFLLLLGAGLGLLQRRSLWLALPVAALIVGGAGWSTANYYTSPLYAKDDYRAFGDYVRARVMPGDAVIYLPPTSWRIFDYYAGMDRIESAVSKGVNIPVFAVPTLDQTRDLDAFLDDLGGKVRRIWVFKGHPFYENEGEALETLAKHFVLIRDFPFFSHQSLHAFLYLPHDPSLPGTSEELRQPIEAGFGDELRLVGVGADTSAWDAGVTDLPLPVLLYWQVDSKPDRNYKYILQLVAEKDGERTVLATAEHEPFEASIPTTWWDPGKTIVEPVELTGAQPAPGAQIVLTVQVYDADTLEKLPAHAGEGASVAEDGVTVVIPCPVLDR